MSLDLQLATIMIHNVFDYSANDLNGKPVDLSRYRGHVMLIANTASECGFTPQYRGLEELNREYAAQGLAVIGFPCNQFGKQEPGDAHQIGAFCEKNYGVTFPIFEKIDVNGSNAHPLFKHLERAAPGVLGTEFIKWNFTKFLIRKDGSVFKRYAPATKPDEMRPDIAALLAE